MAATSKENAFNFTFSGSELLDVDKVPIMFQNFTQIPDELSISAETFSKIDRG